MKSFCHLFEHFLTILDRSYGDHPSMLRLHFGIILLNIFKLNENSTYAFLLLSLERKIANFDHFSSYSKLTVDRLLSTISEGALKRDKTEHRSV